MARSEKTPPKAAVTKAKAPKFKALPPPELCACPSGSRSGVENGETVCVRRDSEGRRRIVSLTCDRRVRSYKIGPPQTRTERGEGKSGEKRQIVVTGPGLDYDTASAPCGTKRKGCPVQLVFRKGQPFLRFCKKAGNNEPGHFVSVPDVSEARKLTAAACAEWAAAGGRFTSTNPAIRAAGGALGRPRVRRAN